MTQRLFISYRTADGMDKATALARDLGRVFGDAAVFLDKDDLAGGSAWKQEIGRTLRERPILLLLLTPGVLEARAADGTLRIASPDDPVRRELQDALDAKAHVIPVLCDGLQAPPDAGTLPPPFDRLGDLTWRKLRAYDWAADVARLVSDLRGLGLGEAPASRAAPLRRAGMILAAIVVGGAAALWWHRTHLPPPTPAEALAGRWRAMLWQGEQTVLTLRPSPQGLELLSEPIPIAQRADWADYRAFWRERFKSDLDAVMYRGEGLVRADPGQPVAIDIGLKVHPAPGGGEPIDGGNLSATLSADGRTLTGTIWLNGAQKQQAATLVREERSK